MPRNVARFVLMIHTQAERGRDPRRGRQEPHSVSVSGHGAGRQPGGNQTSGRGASIPTTRSVPRRHLGQG